MIYYIKKSSVFEQIENYLLSHQDSEWRSTRFVYYFKQVGDCAGIFRRALEGSTKHNRKKGDEELVAYYHEGEF